ncbi:MAG: hypothetical protein MZV64_01825 [Ignavibacteriales bacterium]|nr:hypothetical protein [Ignavibacteriales bacterium]
MSSSGWRATRASVRPRRRQTGRNRDWQHLNNLDIISMPDKWEYPWYAAWDLAFHAVPLALVDSDFAKRQLDSNDTRVVHAPQWPTAGLRMDFRRCRTRRYTPGRPGGFTRSMPNSSGQADRRFLRSHLPQAAAQFHLVDQP